MNERLYDEVAFANSYSYFPQYYTHDYNRPNKFSEERRMLELVAHFFVNVAKAYITHSVVKIIITITM